MTSLPGLGFFLAPDATSRSGRQRFCGGVCLDPRPHHNRTSASCSLRLSYWPLSADSWLPPFEARVKKHGQSSQTSRLCFTSQSTRGTGEVVITVEQNIDKSIALFIRRRFSAVTSLDAILAAQLSIKVVDFECLRMSCSCRPSPTA